jgi:thymidylate synthase (FAD)
VCAIAACTSSAAESPGEIAERMDKDKRAKILRHVVRSGHHSVIEHANFSFSVKGISRACSHQLVRHRIASYTQQSQRYVTFKDLTYVMPPKVAQDAKAKAVFEEAMRNSSDAYKKLTAAGILAEDARYVYPNASTTNIYITMNARELKHFFRLRCCNRAQWEIREMADLMLTVAKKVAPIIFENSGPACVELGRCPEAKPCGRFEEVREKYHVHKLGEFEAR